MPSFLSSGFTSVGGISYNFEYVILPTTRLGSGEKSWDNYYTAVPNWNPNQKRPNEWLNLRMTDKIYITYRPIQPFDLSQDPAGKFVCFTDFEPADKRANFKLLRTLREVEPGAWPKTPTPDETLIATQLDLAAINKAAEDTEKKTLAGPRTPSPPPPSPSAAAMTTSTTTVNAALTVATTTATTPTKSKPEPGSGVKVKEPAVTPLPSPSTMEKLIEKQIQSSLEKLMANTKKEPVTTKSQNTSGNGSRSDSGSNNKDKGTLELETRIRREVTEELEAKMRAREQRSSPRQNYHQNYHQNRRQEFHRTETDYYRNRRRSRSQSRTPPRRRDQERRRERDRSGERHRFRSGEKGREGESQKKEAGTDVKPTEVGAVELIRQGLEQLAAQKKTITPEPVGPTLQEQQQLLLQQQQEEQQRQLRELQQQQLKIRDQLRVQQQQQAALSEATRQPAAHSTFGLPGPEPAMMLPYPVPRSRIQPPAKRPNLEVEWERLQSPGDTPERPRKYSAGAIPSSSASSPTQHQLWIQFQQAQRQRQQDRAKNKTDVNGILRLPDY